MGPTRAYIDHERLRHNIALIRNAVGDAGIMAVVKANAYGHGDVEVTRTVLTAGCEYLGVAFPAEGIRLRKAGIEAPVLVFGAHDVGSLEEAVRHNLEITITGFEQANALQNLLSSTGMKARVHLKIDTGMNRVGFDHREFASVAEELSNFAALEIKGIYSHFSTSDDDDPSYAQLQISRFNQVRDFFQKKISANILFHMANSGAIMRFPEACYDLVRPGIMLYGHPPSPSFTTDWRLKQVMTLQSALGLIKLVKKNEPISYGRRFYTSKDTYIGVIPAGYADGISRLNTNNALVYINGAGYPLVGTVCMDMVMIDLGPELKCKTGDAVVIYGDEMPVNKVAKRCNTIAYEVTCNVSARVERIHHNT